MGGFRRDQGRLPLIYVEYLSPNITTVKISAPSLKKFDSCQRDIYSKHSFTTPIYTLFRIDASGTFYYGLICKVVRTTATGF